jgi:CubicO group peptidase (beta-lactamase class C family)
VSDLDLSPEIEPREAGFDAERLARLDRHLAGYVDEGGLAGWQVLVARGGRIVHLGMHGARNAETGAPVEQDTLWRIYSMTKPVTSVAVLQLFEKGLLSLDDPVERWIPSFGSARVFTGGTSETPQTRPVEEPVRVWHLLSHTAGLTYGWHYQHPVDAIYRAAGLEARAPEGMDLATAVDAWAGMPLWYEPGTEWGYSVSVDVLGRLIEVVSGQSLGDYFSEQIFGPLDMRDAGFWLNEEQAERLATMYEHDPETHRIRSVDSSPPQSAPLAPSGGGGLFASLRDYHRFTQMLARGGELDGRRLLGSRTVQLMTRNHLPGGATLSQIGHPLGTPLHGMGFGLGVAVLIDPQAIHSYGSKGLYGWSGAASTIFNVDPKEELVILFMTQLVPIGTLPVDPELRTLVYQALVD